MADLFWQFVSATGLGHVQLLILLLLLPWKGIRPYLAAPALSAAAAGLIRLAIVPWVDRQRPSNFAFARPLESLYANTSFPSGHSATSFAIAFAVLLMPKPERWFWLGPILFVWAIGVAYSRIYVGVHYPTDVAGGAGIGLAVAAAVRLCLDSQKKIVTKGDISDKSAI